MSDKNEAVGEVKPLDYAEHVWDKLSRIDVKPHTRQLEATKKRPAVDYLPWHKAWLLLKREFPASTYEHSDDINHQGGTVEVEVYVAIRKTLGGDVHFTTARLPVMDYIFQAIHDPDARALNDARQRCLVKALAFAGLGLDLWSESPVPVGRFLDPISKKQAETLEKLIKDSKTDRDMFVEWCECEIEELPIERYSSAKGLLTAKLSSQS